MSEQATQTVGKLFAPYFEQAGAGRDRIWHLRYLRGPDRTQVQLLPPCLDDYVGADAPARFIDAYAESLYFQALGFTQAQPPATGRPPYHPADLLKLYLYGYLQRVRSSRRLAAEATRNLELLWLWRGLRPDFKTIADFRKNNRAAFKPLFKNFNLLCRRLNLFGAELVAIDGSKFKAVNNTRRHYTQDQLQELLQNMETRIDEYLCELDRQDTAAEGLPAAPGRQELQDKIARLQERQGRSDERLGELPASGQHEISLTDPASRKMKGAHGCLIGYNVQVAGDAQHDLIVAAAVVQDANDLGQRSALALAAQEDLQVETLQVVADKGCQQADQLAACEPTGLETFVPAPATTSGQGRDGRDIFPKEQFRYDAGADAYHCPGDRLLPRARAAQGPNADRIDYYDRAACRDCGIKNQCTSGSFRLIGRRMHEAVVARAAARVAAHPEKVARRKEIVEHVFGTLRNWGHDTFLLRGLDKVQGEFSLSALVYHLRRVLNLLSLEDLLAGLKKPAADAV